MRSNWCSSLPAVMVHVCAKLKLTLTTKNNTGGSDGLGIYIGVGGAVVGIVAVIKKQHFNANTRREETGRPRLFFSRNKSSSQYCNLQ